MKDRYNIPAVVGDNLRRIRSRRNISQLELSNLTGLSHTFINNIENGKKWISAETLSVFCRELDAWPFEFFITDDIPDADSAYRNLQKQNSMILELDEVLARYRKGEGQ